MLLHQIISGEQNIWRAIHSVGWALIAVLVNPNNPLALRQFQKHPFPPGQLLTWGCRDNVAYWILLKAREHAYPLDDDIVRRVFALYDQLECIPVNPIEL
ncbi:MAG: hypothetical protein AWT59_3212 [Candidatus Gallionella acididurans]|uniref:Uncharacterized protein n=1 Tax=Candidatus Gallionella acididurans TaxID=1796491 RepID=A0A139BNW4_9PROT|nr:MAG: hypothetical protein AWT59_3212 [Candidatus Gallionella acididurans]